MQQFTVDVQGATLAGEQRGSGAPLVLIHGMGSSRAGWDRVLAHLPQSLPVLRYDLRGFGASVADPDAEYSHAEDLLALLDARGIDRATLCGLSMGGGVAAALAIAAPQRVERLVLISPALHGWEWSAEWRGLWREVGRAAKTEDIALARDLWFAHPMFAAAREDPQAAADLRQEIDAFPGRQWFRDSQRPVLPDVEQLHRIAAPALLLTGTRDVPDFRLIADLLAGAVPALRRVDYPGAGHMLPLERAAEVAAEIAEFMAG